MSLSPNLASPDLLPAIDHGGLIWVVDDSPLETELARRLLGENHEVRTFTDGATVLEQLAEGTRPDVLVLDWHMPQMSGLEMCRFLRERYNEATLPILVLTATGGQEDALEALTAGANDFVTKAFDPAELRARIATLVRSRHLHDRLERAEAAAQQAREAAEEANRAKDVFMATVSHELRTPLNSILGWARLLSEKALDKVTMRRGLETIERNAKIQVQLIEDILDTTRVVSGKLHLEVAALSLSQVVRAAIDSVKPALDTKRLRLEVALDDGEHTRMNGDADRLQQAVWNLLSNAIKFTPAGGSIRVELRRTLTALELRVIDSGKGITSDFLPYVFDRFRQEDGAMTRRYSGLGLGLALVRHIVLAHGGTVTASSPGDGQGATFSVSLPCDESPLSRNAESWPSQELTASPDSVTGGQLSQLKILVVEDDDDARDLLVTVLAQQGAQVSSAGSCPEALAELARELPHVLLSDIGLPGEDGYELVRRVRARGHTKEQLPAIALTAYARREDRLAALRAGFQAHVAKPVEPTELVAVIANVARVPVAG